MPKAEVRLEMAAGEKAHAKKTGKRQEIHEKQMKK
jgi:hypothetical protein